MTGIWSRQVKAPHLILPVLIDGIESDPDPAQVYTPQDVDTIVEVLRLDSKQAGGPGSARFDSVAEAIGRAMQDKLDEMVSRIFMGY